MHRIDTPTAQKDKFGAGKNGFTNGDPTAGIRSTQLVDSYWDSIQEEICAVIEGAGFALDKSKNNQLLAAIRAILNKKVSDNALLKANNLADLSNKAAALKNLGVINAIYPVGIVAWFAQNKNPNTLFPGTTWVYINGVGRTIRLAAANGSDVMTTGGADSVSLAVANLPAHNHTFSATTSSFDYGTKASSNFDYGTKSTNSNGAHTHAVNGVWTGQVTRGGGNEWPTAGNASNVTTSQAGAHAHTVAIGAHSHTVAIGAHTHTLSGTTSNTGNGTAVNITNQFIKLMGWYRSA